MEKFTKVVTDIEQLKNYKDDLKMSISVLAKNESEANEKFGNLGLNYPYKIVSVKEDIDTNKELSAEEVIKNEWAKKPSSMDSYEFYHLMRNENYDGSIIKTVIGVV